MAALVCTVAASPWAIGKYAAFQPKTGQVLGTLRTHSHACDHARAHRPSVDYPE